MSYEYDPYHAEALTFFDSWDHLLDQVTCPFGRLTPLDRHRNSVWGFRVERLAGLGSGAGECGRCLDTPRTPTQQQESGDGSPRVGRRSLG